MSKQAYSSRAREDDPHSLPNIEVFYDEVEHMWYWWACFPGCIPDGEPIGPFATEAEALADAQDE